MKTTYSPSQSQSLKNLESLLFLTDEPDEHLYINIANAIVAYGEQVLPFLREKLEKTTDGFHAHRLENLISTIERHSLMDRLNSWHDKREDDLLEPYFILSKYMYPKADWTGIGFQIVMMIEQVEKELNYNLTPLEQVRILNHIIYDINRFKGDKVAVGNQDYYYVNTLLETHVGNPFSLGMLYCIVAERLNLPIYPVLLPHHFVLAYCKKTRHFPQLEDVLFYINPFNNGIVLTRRDIRSYLDQLNVKSELKYFEPTRNTSVIRNIFNMELRV
ncbi:MAG: transglutaminase family protein [Bacteroidales bacterium]|nr:transglutaminase family protein [Bacteroidales bacterium]